jgi:hypothetical protein
MSDARLREMEPPPARRRLDAASGSFGRTQAAKSCKIVPQPSKSALLAIDGTFTNDRGAIMGKSQIIHTDGEDLVVITLSDYEALRARAGDEASEDAMTVRIVAATDAKIARGEDVTLPAAVWAAIESGEHPNIPDRSPLLLEKPRYGPVGKPHKAAAVSSWNLDVPVSHYNCNFFCPRAPLLKAFPRVVRYPGLLHRRSPVDQSLVYRPAEDTDRIGNIFGNPSVRNWLFRPRILAVCLASLGRPRRVNGARK